MSERPQVDQQPTEQIPNPSRRVFLQGLGAFAGGIAIASMLGETGIAKAQEEADPAAPDNTDLIATDGSIVDTSEDPAPEIEQQAVAYYEKRDSQGRLILKIIDKTTGPTKVRIVPRKSDLEQAWLDAATKLIYPDDPNSKNTISIPFEIDLVDQNATDLVDSDPHEVHDSAGGLMFIANRSNVKTTIEGVDAFSLRMYIPTKSNTELNAFQQLVNSGNQQPEIVLNNYISSGVDATNGDPRKASVFGPTLIQRAPFTIVQFPVDNPSAQQDWFSTLP